MDAYYKPETRFLKLYNGKTKNNNILATDDIPGAKPKRHIYDKKDLLGDYQKHLGERANINLSQPAYRNRKGRLNNYPYTLPQMKYNPVSNAQHEVDYYNLPPDYQVINGKVEHVPQQQKQPQEVRFNDEPPQDIYGQYMQGGQQQNSNNQGQYQQQGQYNQQNEHNYNQGGNGQNYQQGNSGQNYQQAGGQNYQQGGGNNYQQNDQYQQQQTNSRHGYGEQQQQQYGQQQRQGSGHQRTSSQPDVQNYQQQDDQRELFPGQHTYEQGGSSRQGFQNNNTVPKNQRDVGNQRYEVVNNVLQPSQSVDLKQGPLASMRNPMYADYDYVNKPVPGRESRSNLNLQQQQADNYGGSYHQQNQGGYNQQNQSGLYNQGQQGSGNYNQQQQGGGQPHKPQLRIDAPDTLDAFASEFQQQKQKAQTTTGGDQQKFKTDWLDFYGVTPKPTGKNIGSPQQNHFSANPLPAKLRPSQSEKIDPKKQEQILYHADSAKFFGGEPSQEEVFEKNKNAFYRGYTPDAQNIQPKSFIKSDQNGNQFKYDSRQYVQVNPVTKQPMYTWEHKPFKKEKFVVKDMNHDWNLKQNAERFWAA